MCDPIHTTKYVHADIPNTSTRACIARIPTFIPMYSAIVYTIHKHAPLMRTGYVQHSQKYFECGVVGKCCSNVLRSLIPYGVVVKAVRTCVCEKNDTAHVRSSRCAIPYTKLRTRSYTSMHTCMPTYQIQARVHVLHVHLPSFQCTTQ
jgi:hypothetical protein